MSSKLTILLNIQKVILTTKLASPYVMGKPTVVATDSLIFHLIIHQADAWNKSEYLHMGIWLQVVITLYKGHNNWYIDCSHGVSSTEYEYGLLCLLCLHHHRKTYMTIFILYKWNTQYKLESSQVAKFLQMTLAIDYVTYHNHIIF